MSLIGKHRNINVTVRRTAAECDHEEMMAQWPIMLEGPEFICLTLRQAKDLVRFILTQDFGLLTDPPEDWYTSEGPGADGGDFQTLRVSCGKVILCERFPSITTEVIELGSIAEAVEFAGLLHRAVLTVESKKNCWAMNLQRQPLLQRD